MIFRAKTPAKIFPLNWAPEGATAANVLPYGGLSPANCRECDSVLLPTTAADHDLAAFLVECVTPDENGDAVLHTAKVLACVKEEFKR